MNHFSTGLWHATKSWLHMTTVDNQLSSWTEKKLQSTSQSQTCTRKRSWSVFGGLLPVWSATTLWILATPLRLKSMLSKLMRCAENCSTCSQRWSIERARFYSTTTHNHTSHNHATKVEQIGLQSFALSALFTWPFSNWLPLFQASWRLFAGKTVL